MTYETFEQIQTGVLWFGVLAFGACVGSFLNVVIYRLPLGLSVNKPKRSFCPQCRKEIPAYRNIPLFTWLLQRGKCAECKAPIPFRYFAVEFLTCLLFGAVWWLWSDQPLLAGGLMLFISVLVAVSMIDADHMIIPVKTVWVASVIGVLIAAFAPRLVQMGESPLVDTWQAGLKWSLLGWAFGYALLQLVVWGGKLVFGRQKMNFSATEGSWYLKEPESDDDQLCFVLDGEDMGWGDLFYRPTDRLEIELSSLQLNGDPVEVDSIVIRENQVEWDGGAQTIEELKSLAGRATRIVIPREAMGGGDPPLLAFIGAFLGPYAVIFTLFTSSLYAILGAIFGRFGFGKHLPYGPFLALGGLTWAFGGWQLWQKYLEAVLR